MPLVGIIVKQESFRSCFALLCGDFGPQMTADEMHILGSSFFLGSVI